MSLARQRLLGLLLLAPALVFVLGVVAYPLAQALWLSLTNAQVGEAGRFIGLANYRYLLDQGTYHDAFRNTLVYTLAGTVLKAAVGLGPRWRWSGPSWAVAWATQPFSCRSCSQQ